jgi:hypothetical protein
VDQSLCKYREGTKIDKLKGFFGLALLDAWVNLNLSNPLISGTLELSNLTLTP